MDRLRCRGAVCCRRHGCISRAKRPFWTRAQGSGRYLRSNWVWEETVSRILSLGPGTYSEKCRDQSSPSQAEDPAVYCPGYNCMDYFPFCSAGHMHPAPSSRSADRVRHTALHFRPQQGHRGIDCEWQPKVLRRELAALDLCRGRTNAGGIAGSHSLLYPKAKVSYRAGAVRPTS
jgi:hypothetical protein